MALKKQHDMMAMFSMASMTDVIFLLLIFFMVTSTFEVNLPQSSTQTALKPGTRVYIDKEQNIFASFGEEEPQPIEENALLAFLKMTQQQAPESYIALYADEEVPYGKVVEMLEMGARNNLKVVLATKPARKNRNKQ